MQTTKAYRKESSVRGKGSAPGCIPKLLFSCPDSALHRGNQALCARSFTHRCVSVGIKKDSDRVRFIRAILKSKGLSMWSCLPLCPHGKGLPFEHWPLYTTQNYKQIHLNLSFISLEVPECGSDIKKKVWNLKVFCKVKHPWQPKENLASRSKEAKVAFS